MEGFFRRRRVHYAWVVAAATFLVMLVTAGAAGAPGVLLIPLQREFGWTAAEVSGAIGLRLALFGLVAPFAAAFMNRFGLRTVVLASLGLITLGMGLSVFMRELWHLVLLWGVLVGAGAGLTALVLAATVATRWFEHRRGLVVGLLTASSATGQLIVLPLLAQSVETMGWRATVIMMCALYMLAALVAAAFLRNSPSDVGLAAYGATDPSPRAPPRANGSVFAAPFGALRSAARVPLFWIMFGTFFICGASTNGLVQMHLIPMCGDFGIAATSAAGLLALMGVFDFIGTVASGWLSDRYDNRKLLFWYYGLRGLSLIFLANSDFSIIGLSLFAVFYGLDWIATVPPTVKLIAQRFGAAQANLVFGWVFAGHQIGAGVAAFGAGAVRSSLGSYLPAFQTAGILCLLAALAVVLINRTGARPISLRSGPAPT
jgi:predicted MFS family arabinose efflux permease